MKFQKFGKQSTQYMSPSVWREWIEMCIITCFALLIFVSLRVEGVD